MESLDLASWLMEVRLCRGRNGAGVDLHTILDDMTALNLLILLYMLYSSLCGSERAPATLQRSRVC